MVVKQPRKRINYSQPLVKLGLTPEEAKCYTLLLKEGSASAKSLSEAAGILPNAVYRLIASLKEKGFVVELDTHHTKFQALPAQVAVTAFAKEKIKDIEEYQTASISSLSSTSSATSTSVEILTGRQAMFLKGAEMIKQAKKEILIISIGEPVPDEIKLANRDAVAKGLPVKFLVHKYDRENRALLDSWVRMGLLVRHYPGAGYHLSVVDGKTCLLAASNPDNPAERTSMFINSEGLAGAMRSYFYSLWEKALPIKISELPPQEKSTSRPV